MKKGPGVGPSGDPCPTPDRATRCYFFLAPPLGAAFVGAAFAALLAGAGLAFVSPLM
jgi:hypothetical protein